MDAMKAHVSKLHIMIGKGRGRGRGRGRGGDYFKKIIFYIYLKGQIRVSITSLISVSLGFVYVY